MPRHTAEYIGDDAFDPIWAELDRRGAVVFLHGAQTPSSTPYPHALLGVPVTEVPNETYKAAAQVGVKPDIDTYNLLLEGCVGARHRQLGDRLLADMKEAGIKPDVTTYQRMVLLCLTQTTYEDAFFYLEEMKALKIVPPIEVYEHIIRKLVHVGDTRYKIALEELKECGYEVSSRLHSFISSGGNHNGPRSAQVAEPVVL